MQRKELMWAAMRIYKEERIDFSDAMIAAEMPTLSLSEIYSFDHDFDQFEDVTRVEP